MSHTRRLKRIRRTQIQGPLGIADLEKAVEIGRKKGDRQPYYGRAWAALGDGYWR